ncbi:TAXI family TRAP transporter solute-binding subunit [Pseudorhodoferax sp.]|uniref:TAXI family TRAP transporter solute-binding subunit n=1 Tax=Pseudorhodoferax sp. TaxID=1993553 RepID=UPI0039E3646F
MPRLLRLALLGLRDMLASAGPVAVLAVAILVGAYWYLQPQPPRTVTLATGPAGSAYAAFGQRYAQALARDGITVVLRATEGSQDNLALLRNGGADVAFVRGGSADPVADGEAGLLSLGALFYEPLWVFYRHDALRRTPQGLASLRRLRVNVDSPGSGVPDIVQRMLQANRIDPATMALSNLAPAPAAEALRAGLLDVVVLASAPESPLVQQLLRSSGIGLLDLRHADAYTRIFPFFSAVQLPRGIVDLAADLPSSDVAMVAATTSLLAREDTHPALRQLFAQAAQTLHGEAGWFNRAREFPNTRTSELPVSAEGDRAINGTPPFWQRYLPFWASNLVDRMWLVLGGLLVLLLPLSRVVPPLYTFRVRRRVFRWYGRLREIEARADRAERPAQALLDELDALDRVVDKVAVPLSHTDELYALRRNIHAVRKRVLAHGEAATSAP